ATGYFTQSIPARVRWANTGMKLFSLVVLCAPLRNPQRPALKKERRIRDTNNPLPELRAEPKPKDCCAVGLGRFGQFFDADFQAEHLQAANEVFALLPGMVAIKVITAEFGVALIALQNMIDDHQQRMGHGHQCFLAAQAFNQTKVLAAQVAVLFHGRAPGSLDQTRAQVSVAFARAAREAFATRGFVAGTDACPTRQLGVAPKVNFHL